MQGNTNAIYIIAHYKSFPVCTRWSAVLYITYHYRAIQVVRWYVKILLMDVSTWPVSLVGETLSVQGPFREFSQEYKVTMTG